MKPVRFKRMSPTRFRAEIGRLAFGVRLTKPDPTLARVTHLEKVISRALWREDRKAKRQAIARMRRKKATLTKAIKR